MFGRLGAVFLPAALPATNSLCLTILLPPSILFSGKPRPPPFPYTLRPTAAVVNAFSALNRAKLQRITITRQPIQATGAKDGFEDFARHQADAQENSRMVTRLVMSGQGRLRSSKGNISTERPACGGGGGGAAGEGGRKRPREDTERVSWMGVRVGDVLEIHNRENIPADLVMLSCSDPKGTCFVMTSNLDGETNLKPRVVSPDVREAVAAAEDAAAAPAAAAGGGGGGGSQGLLSLAAKGAFVECDLPNQKLEHFDGALAVRGGMVMNDTWKKNPLRENNNNTVHSYLK